MFHCDGEIVDKQLAIGDGFMRTSAERPEWSWSAILWHPAEAAVSSRLARARDSHRLSRPPVLDQRQRLLARVLLRGLDVLRLLFPPLAQGGDVISQLFT